MKFTILLLICNLFAAQAQNAFSDTIIFRIAEVDTKPVLADSSYKLSKFISENIEMPTISNKKIQLITSFVIERDGSFSDVKFVHLKSESLIKAENAGLEDSFEVIPELEYLKREIVRVICLSESKWIPATIGGKPVRCLFHYPVKMSIE